MLSVVHSLPGRTRFHLNSSFSPTMIEYLIRSLPCVSSATYTQETGNVLIHHDPTLSLHMLKKSLRQIMRQKEGETNSAIFMEKTRTCGGLYSYISSKLVYPT